ncbi:MAG: NADH-quinone oxidoreductase subunit N [Gemmataceae bacterium]
MLLSLSAIDRYLRALELDLVAFLPELLLCMAIVFLLVLRLTKMTDRWHMGEVSFIITLLALLVSWCQWSGYGEEYGLFTPLDIDVISKQHEMFSGLLVYDNFTIFLRMFLIGFAALVIWLSLLTGIPEREDSADFCVLLLGATVGMSLMASANHLLMVFIAVEMASVPSYALAGFLKTKRQSSEASLKYVVYGGGAAGVMLFGISLIAGTFGTGYLPDVAKGFVAVLHEGSDPSQKMVLLLGTLFVLIGVMFKIAAVPFHFWCPDVFEGAATEVAAFLSVASKGAALALLARFAFVLSGLAALTTRHYASWHEIAQFLIPGLAFLAALTATFGNLAAFPQTNLKRLLAYSTIAHAGYMMMGLATLSKEGAGAVLFYLVAYLFMNLGAFAIVAFLRNQTGSEDLNDYRGLIYRAPLMTVLLAVFLLSLLGIPPLAGFAAKFQIFRVLYDAGNSYSTHGDVSLGYTMYALLVVGGINTVISAVYYLKVMKVMILERSLEELEGEEPEPLPVTPGSAFYGMLLAGMIFFVGIFWNPLARATDAGVNRFYKAPRPMSQATAQQVKPS